MELEIHTFYQAFGKKLGIKLGFFVNRFLKFFGDQVFKKMKTTKSREDPIMEVEIETLKSRLIEKLKDH